MLSPGTHLYFDHPQEPDPEERGLYWACRYADTLKVFSFAPDNLFSNADVRLTGEAFTADEVKALLEDEEYVPLEKPDNIIGDYTWRWKVGWDRKMPYLQKSHQCCGLSESIMWRMQQKKKALEAEKWLGYFLRMMNMFLWKSLTTSCVIFPEDRLQDWIESSHICRHLTSAVVSQKVLCG